jgi:hypothetical protein
VIGPHSEHPERRRYSALCVEWTVPALWVVATVLALASTLHSLRTDDFDGLNNIYLLPLALPWCVVPIPSFFGLTYSGESWVLAVMAVYNAVLAHHWLRARARRDTGTTRGARPSVWPTRKYVVAFVTGIVVMIVASAIVRSAT